MKILIVYPNLPLMITPATSVGLFTAIAKNNNCQVYLFETTLYSDHENAGMLYKSKVGGGRPYKLKDVSLEIKPTNTVIKDFVDKVDNINPDLLLFSTVEDTLKDTVMLLNAIKHKKIPHIVGGVLPINDPYVCLEQKEIEVICRYEGELVLQEVINSFNSNWKDTKGLWYKKDGVIYKNELQPLVNINNIIPDYSLYSSVRFNRPIGGKIRKAVQFETYRGCPYSCTFCNSPMTRQLDKNFLRRKDIDTIEKELDYYIKTINPDYFFILDDSFLARPKKEIFAICNLLKKYKIPWWNNTRLENIDKDILQAMQESYCDRIQFGIECGNEEYRKKVLYRNISNDTYYKKAEILNSFKIPYGLNVIIGFPGETRDMVFETVDLIKAIKGYDGLGVSIFIPYRGTKLRDYAVKNNWLDKNWISGSGYLTGGSPLKMPKPYLQNNEIIELSQKFKYYCFFNKSYWDYIDNTKNLDILEDIYNKKFYTKYAAIPKVHINRRNTIKYSCESTEELDFRAML